MPCLIFIFLGPPILGLVTEAYTSKILCTIWMRYIVYNIEFRNKIGASILYTLIKYKERGGLSGKVFCRVNYLISLLCIVQ